MAHTEFCNITPMHLFSIAFSGLNLIIIKATNEFKPSHYNLKYK